MSECGVCGKRLKSAEGLAMHQAAVHAGKSAPDCPYCGEASELRGGDYVYPHRPDLFAKKFYVCRPCGARVGCHPGTVKPLGRLASTELRRLKMACHENFDPIWKEAQRLGDKGARNKAYAWLADSMWIDKADCHFGMFDEETAGRAIDILINMGGQLRKKLADDRAEYLKAKAD